MIYKFTQSNYFKDFFSSGNNSLLKHVNQSMIDCQTKISHFTLKKCAPKASYYAVIIVQNGKALLSKCVWNSDLTSPSLDVE